MPELIGGLASIQNELNYPEAAKDDGAEGRVIVRFIVDERGRVTHPEVVRGIHPKLDSEALHAVSPASFTPGLQNGHPVPVRITLPVSFKLDRDPADRRDADSLREMPELVGGLRSLQERLRYPEDAKEAGLEGRVIVQFVVNENGDVVEADVVRGISPRLDAEALRVVREAQFEPAYRAGDPVRVQMSLPVTFKLEKAPRDA